MVALHVTPVAHEPGPRHAALHLVLPQLTAPMQALGPLQQRVLAVAPLVTLPAHAAAPPQTTLHAWLAGAHVTSPAHVLFAVHPTLQVAAAHCTVLAHAPMPAQAMSHLLVAVQATLSRHEPCAHPIEQFWPAQLVFPRHAVVTPASRPQSITQELVALQ